MLNRDGEGQMSEQSEAVLVEESKSLFFLGGYVLYFKFSSNGGNDYSDDNVHNYHYIHHNHDFIIILSR